MIWSGLPDISEVGQSGEDDRRITSEVKGVLERNGAVDRFGMALLHSHFERADDELLVETVDVENRTLKIEAVSRAAASEADELVPTAWRLDGPVAVPITYCWRTGEFHMNSSVGRKAGAMLNSVDN